jgi:nucleotide-binding universal stress UspA family protein
LKAERARFLQHTHLDDLHPETQVEVTCPGCYEKLEEHIAVHGYFLGKDRQCEICWQEAVNSWHDNVYLPMAQIIRQHNLLQDFQGRTEADLYLWIMEHRHYLAEELGQEIDLAQAAAHFAEEYSRRLKRVVGRASQRLAGVLTPDQLEPGPPPGQWRAERVQPRGEGPLFADILLPVDGSTSAWCAVEQAITIAQREKGSFYGIYVAPADADAAGAAALRDEFARRCENRNVTWKFIVEEGDPGRVIVERAHWADLIVLSQQGEGARWPERVLGSTFRAVARRAPRPVLSALDRCSLLSKALLAYDGSPESEEALFVAAYVGSKWGLPLAVVTVEESRRADEGTLHKAVAYLNEHGAQAEALLRNGDAAEAILAAAQEVGCDLMMMGGSGYSPFGQLFTRSTVSRVLREAPCPVLLCR